MGKDLSPITGIIEESIVIIEFGEHEGRTIKEINQIDPNFYASLATEKKSGHFAIRRHRDKTFRLYLNPLSETDH